MTKTEHQFTANGLDILTGAFLEELEAADNPAAVLRKYQDAYPQLAALFEELASLEDALSAVRLIEEGEYPQTLPDFHIIREISRGGMGVVFMAQQESLKRRVALKIDRGRLKGPELQRFRREQLALAQLHHSNIVPIHVSDEYGPWRYFAMTYIKSASLRHIIDHTKKLASRSAKDLPPLTTTARDLLKLRNDPTDTDPGKPPAEPIITLSKTVKHTEQSPRPTNYFDSVATLMATVAEAVHYAHTLHIIHRDLHPGNVLIDANGNPQLIDFGLAGLTSSESDWIGESDTVPSPIDADGGGDGKLTQGPMGNPRYMSPESWKTPTAKPGAHIDIWGLGVILYELLSLRPAFGGETAMDIGLNIVEKDPPRIWTLVKNVPRDLVAICEKAMRKDPADRYPTAQAFADDLRQWLRREPAEARGPNWVREWIRRPWMWVMRNKILSGVVALAFAALLTAGYMRVRSVAAESRAKQADANRKTADAENQAREAQLHADAADDRARGQERTVQIQSLERIRLVEKELGWSEKAWGMMKELTKLGSDTKLRDQAAALLIGYDATTPKALPKPISFATAALAWDPKGGRLLMGGNSRQPAQFWDAKKDVVKSQQVGRGPVTFTKDGRPLQLVEANSGLLVWDADKNKSVCELDLPDNGKGKWAALVLSEDGSRAAALTSTADGKTSIVTWDATSGKLLKQWERESTMIALTPDGTFLAAGSKDGTVTVFAVPDGKEVATLRGTRRSEVSALAFGRNVVRPRDGAGPLGNWLLAVGDTGASVVIWNPELKIPVSYCDGSSHHIFALAFSPDGTTLASAGRTFVNLWDIATGKHVLRIPISDYHYALAFSPDGERLAVSGATSTFEPEVRVFHLQNGRGLTALRGLVGEIAKVAFSPDGTKIVAVSHKFDTAVWEWPSGRLLYMFDTPKGTWADNLALAFSHDGKRLAYSSHNRAVMYDLTTGKELQSWNLPAALVEHMAFDKTGEKLMLFRAETDDPKVTPDGSAHPTKYPRVCCLRKLLADGSNELVGEKIKDFDWHVFETVIAADASVIVVSGEQRVGMGKKRVVKAFDGMTGKELWAMKTTRTDDGQGFVLDPSGTFLLLSLDASSDRHLIEVQTQKPIAVLRGDAGGGLSPGAEYWGCRKDNGFAIGRRADKDALLLLGLDLPVTIVRAQFHPKKLQVVWGVRDGTVIVADIPQVKEKLKELKLDW